ncbi:membrane protein [Cupriavidus gilardii CR3]|uniref:Sulfite exporter TauE/SafE family protein n=3 Tax=Cupriavidus gilardii TaxID=82541 RepID=A0ABY4VVL6_9BURK|nr:sulfite exporter TauE/SafE family protein [Cupriavidus gilardii]ALD90868.1 membrane protein [Cupriavidus gilardii CR3]QQE05931.1 sulfite exporter TauE/SafE family protein [Cupriavidus sp. ISTL7]KAB0593132.1 sulfite exporter TauE/SafE family protein [Cupriavidus gilardii]MCT9012032.1 sulfite exporter TauE/SafE family protein [Cupriavidus gilardii]MCT9053831.1 sulfite exporter TauE/SafE family protein [Cupriavidus gilardii]
MAIGVLASVFLLALLGGVHCAAMCGGIALVLEGNDARQAAPVALYRSRAAWVRELLVLHAGRLSAYAVLGALLGAAGAAAWKVQYLPVQRALFAAGSASLLLAGLWALGGARLAGRVPGVEALARRLAASWARWGGRTIARKEAGAAPRGARRLLRRYAAGLAWGLVPCGMVYAALALALLAGSAASGALVMLAFGLGTLPNLLMLSSLSAGLRVLARRPWVRRGIGAAVALFGAAGLARAAMLPETLAAHGFCLTL